ncbi:MAG: restriction endonuclease subunit S [Firmicutes bacterium]|nr:restriction endonuclease subunit S [Bacillota bacterium]
MWKTYQLKELAQIVSGDTPSTKESGYFGGEIPWITPKDLTMQRGRYISKGQRSITEAGYQSCAVHKLPSHSVLVTSRASVGNLAISQGEVCTNQGFRSLVPGEKVDYLFLYYALCYYRDRIISASSGSAFKEISMEGLGRVEISIPEDKAEQLYIANLLDEIDSLIELNDRINNNLC